MRSRTHRKPAQMRTLPPFDRLLAAVIEQAMRDNDADFVELWRSALIERIADAAKEERTQRVVVKVA